MGFESHSFVVTAGPGPPGPGSHSRAQAHTFPHGPGGWAPAAWSPEACQAAAPVSLKDQAGRPEPERRHAGESLARNRLQSESESGFKLICLSEMRHN